MRFSITIISLVLVVTMISGCQRVSRMMTDIFTFRKEQKILVTPRPANINPDNLERMSVPLPIGEHYAINEQKPHYSDIPR